MKAVIFDMDGVIVDTMDLHRNAAIKSLSENGLEVSLEEIKKYDGIKSSEAFKKFFSSKTDEEIDEMLSKKYEFLRKQVKGIKPFPGFFEFLFRLKGKCPLAVVSTSRKAFVEYVLEQIGEKDSFKVILGAEDVFRGKPDPEGYIKAAERLGVKPGDCLVIEDSIVGVKAAKGAGTKCVGVTNTFDKIFLLDADLIVDSLAEISEEKLRGLFNA